MPAAVNARCAALIVSPKYSAVQGTPIRRRSRPGWASSSAHRASAWLCALRRQSAGSGENAIRVASSLRQARSRSSREEMARYRPETATPRRPATAVSVKSATPMSRAAATTSLRENPGLGPVGRPGLVRLPVLRPHMDPQ